MSHFTASWLALREPVDRAARDPGLARRFAAALSNRSRILDLGAGTGANARALSPFFADREAPTWLLVEKDQALLAAQPASMQGLHFESVARDLAAGLDDLAADGIAASAFLDLVGADWLERLTATLVRRRVPFLAALTVDGERRYWPPDPDDARVAAAFARHQRREKGLGPALGAAASAALAARLAPHGFVISTAASDWRIGAERPALLAALVRGEAEAAGSATGWERRRLDQVEQRRLRAHIGHRDLLALPPAG